MPGLFFRKLLPPGIAGLIAVSSSFFMSEARADQAAGTGNSGIIIYSRDVYNRTAIGPGFPGEAHSVVVTGMLAQSLKPLAASETATLTAPLGSLGGTMKGAPVTLALSQGQRSFDLGKLQGSSASGGIVGGQALSALPSALGSMRSALGAGQ